jgi:chromosome segregation ATPase
MAKLTFLLDDAQPIVVPLADNVSIGRREGNDVTVEDMRVSGDHAEIQRIGSDYLLRDLGSKAGTFVNDVRVEVQRLRDGDRINFGPLRAVFDESAEEAAESAAASSQRKTKSAKKTAKKGQQAPQRDALVAVGGIVRLPQVASPAKLAAKPALKARAPKPAKSDERLDAAEAPELSAVQQNLREELGRLQSAKQELSAVESRLREATREFQVKTTRVEQLMADEQRLAQLTTELRTAESQHAEWLVAVASVTAEHDRKSAELQRLATASEAALRESELVAAHKKEMLDHLEHLSRERELALKERELSETRLETLRKTMESTEERAQTAQALLQAREDQVRATEKRLEQMEPRRAELERQISGLAFTHEALVAASGELDKIRAIHASITAEVESLTHQRDELKTALESLRGLISGQQKAHDETTASLAQIKAEHERSESVKASLQTALLTIQDEHRAAETRLAETQARHAELQDCIPELAAVEAQLKQTRIVLQQLSIQQKEKEDWLGVLEDKKAFVQSHIDAAAAHERMLTKRVSELTAEESRLQKSVAELNEQEHEARERFEQLRTLSDEAQDENAEQREALQRGIDLTRRELRDLELKLAPLREWKDEMDKRYEKLAALPEDSAEARALWREIEAEKANLRTLISAQPGGTRGITLSEAVLRGLSGGGTTNENEEQTTATAPTEAPDYSLPAGGAQELALKQRLSRLRENVQREATRLEFLRQERSREESRMRVGSGANETLMKEHERQLESKIRREEEKLAALQRKLELAEVEEERRRDKIAEMERKLAELKADIADAERGRSDARHQAEIAQAEIRSVAEPSLGLRKMGG